MPLLRLNEHYISVQGEGPNTGKMTQFVRFSGCNMRCPGWPCDTQHAIQSALYRQDPKKTSEDMISACLAQRAATGASHICITGGEPFMQDNLQLKLTIIELLNQGFTVDIFTNGSFPFPDWIVQQRINIVMDWKLPGSGEANTALETRLSNVTRLSSKDAIKFVVKDMEDFVSAMHVTDEVILRDVEIFVGRVWDGELSDDDIVKLLQQYQLPWRLNVQLHKHLWPTLDRGI